MKKSLLVSLIIVVVALALSNGCAQPAPAPAAQKEVLLDAIAGEMPTPQYRTFFGAADILKRAGSWVKMSPIESPGVQYNIEYLDKLDADKKSKTIINASDVAYWYARAGKPPYTKKHTNLRAIGGFLVSSSYWVTLDPNIKKLPDDFIGKRIGEFPAVYAQRPYWDILIDKVWGIRDKTTFTRVNFQAGADALRDNTLSAAISAAGLGKGGKWDLHQTLQEVLVRHKVYPLSISKDDVKKVAEIAGEPVATQEVPAGTYGSHQTQPFIGMKIVAVCMAVDASMGEDVVYQLVKTLCENRQMFSDYVEFGDSISAKQLVELAPISDVSEFHPGALKYYREVGAVK